MPSRRSGAADFLGEDPHELAARLERLTGDIRLLASGDGPDLAALGDAPFLDEWSLTLRPVFALTGSLIDNDGAAEGSAVTTEVFAISRKGQWARTLTVFVLLDGRDKGN